MGKWIFDELRGAAVRRKPNETVLFKTEQAGEGEYAGNDSLVREILQNAVDARASDNEPVRVRFAIYDAARAPVAARLAHYFERLKTPLAPQFPFRNNGCPKSPCRFLVCEDFGTRGLEGDTDLFNNPAEGDSTRQDFYWFWRNIGHSAKTGDDLGRWGLGKTVYRAVSRVGCMLGLTIRQSDGKRLLMGQAVLQIHEHGGNEYVPEGFWCAGQNARGVPLPIEEAAEVELFCNEWNLSRTEEPGLSVVAPYVPDELKADRLVQAVVVHFFAPIVRGKLVVEIEGPEFGTVTLDEAGIEAACDMVEWDGPKRTKRHVAPPIKFARRCLSAAPKVTTQLLGTERMPELTDESFGQDELGTLRRQFSGGELTSVRVRLWLPRSDGDGEEGELDVHLERLMDGERCDSYYIREGMTITKINSSASRRGIQALVDVESGPLAKLLGDTEGPAHEDWDTSEERPNAEWKLWKGRVRFVRNIVDNLVAVLTPPTTEPDFDLLSDFFSIERTSGLQRQKRPGEETSERPRLDPPTSEPKWFYITERSGGFTIHRNAHVPMPENASLKVSVAYDLPKGDPIRNWSPFDFRIGPGDGELQPKGKGLRVSLRGGTGNILLLTHMAEEFTFSVRGFDQHRDLFVRVDDVSNTPEAIE